MISQNYVHTVLLSFCPLSTAAMGSFPHCLVLLWSFIHHLWLWFTHPSTDGVWCWMWNFYCSGTGKMWWTWTFFFLHGLAIRDVLYWDQLRLRTIQYRPAERRANFSSSPSQCKAFAEKKKNPAVHYLFILGFIIHNELFNQFMHNGNTIKAETMKKRNFLLQ